MNMHRFLRIVWGVLLGGLSLGVVGGRAQSVDLPLSGEGARGALSIVGFDNELAEPSGPPSREHEVGGVANSHGFPYFRFKYAEANPELFNRYADPDLPSASGWSILLTSHPSADPEVAAGILRRAGAVAWSGLTTATVVPRADADRFTLGELSYDAAGLTGSGVEVLPAAQVTLTVTREDFHFNALGESTAPGTWVGYPYYYWGLDSGYTLAVRDLSGPGLLFVDGRLVGIELAAVAEVKLWGGFVTWTGTLRVTEGGFAYAIKETQFVSGFGDLHLVLDRAGPLRLADAEPTATGQLSWSAGPGGALVLALRGWPKHGYRIETSTDLALWAPLAWVETDAAGVGIGAIPTIATGAGEPRRFYRAVRLAPGETPPPAP
jgi:hypothetical protein